MDGIVLGRAGHYFDASNGSCRTALIVDTFSLDSNPAAPLAGVNVVGWDHGGDSFKRTSVPVDPSPSTAATANSFHLGGQACPFGK